MIPDEEAAAIAAAAAAAAAVVKEVVPEVDGVDADEDATSR